MNLGHDIGTFHFIVPVSSHISTSSTWFDVLHQARYVVYIGRVSNINSCYPIVGFVIGNLSDSINLKYGVGRLAQYVVFE